MKKKTAEYFEEQFNILSNKEYELLSIYETAIKKIKISHLECNNIYEVTPNKFLSNRRCPYCKSKIVAEKESIGFETAKERINNLYNGKFKLIEYNNTKSNCLIECTNCNKKTKIIYANFMNQKKICRCDSNNYFNILRDEKEKELIEYCKNNGYKLLGKYKGCKEKVLIRHLVCGTEWLCSPSNLKRGFGCPKCSESKMEKETSGLLDVFNIEYIQQYKFIDCKNIFPLPFDFYLPIHNICIECDGIQHEKPVDWFGGKEQFKVQKINDSIKNKYCLNNNIKLIRIKHNEISLIKGIIENIKEGG